MQGVIVVVVCFTVTVCLPVLLYGLFKFLPLIYNALNKVMGNVYGRFFRLIDEWVIYWEQSPEDRKAWREAMKKFKRAERKEQ